MTTTSAIDIYVTKGVSMRSCREQSTYRLQQAVPKYFEGLLISGQVQHCPIKTWGTCKAKWLDQLLLLITATLCGRRIVMNVRAQYSTLIFSLSSADWFQNDQD